MQIDVHVGEQIVTGFCAPHPIDTCLMVMSHLVTGTPEGTASCLCQCLIAHDSGKCAVLVICSVSGGIHVTVVDREAVPDVIKPTFNLLLEAHQVFLVLQHGIPYTHQAFHVIILTDGLLHQIITHDKDQTFRFEVEDTALIEHLLAQQEPVGIRHTTGSIPVTLHLTAFDVNLHVRKISQHLINIIELIEDVYGTLITENDGIETPMQIGSATCLMITWALAIGNHLDL